MATGRHRWSLAGACAALVSLAAASVATASVPAATSAGQTALDRYVAAACNANHVIIQIHGTASGGQFRYAAEAGEPDLTAQTQASWIAAAAPRRNDEFDMLLASAINSCRILTFSYDAVYLTPTSGGGPGMYAWNKPQSPWNEDTVLLASRLNALIAALRNANSNVAIDLLSYSAGGIVPMYWAATATDRRNVHGIIVVDGVVSGVDLFVVDLLCALPSSIRNTEIDAYGRFPCHFRRSSPYTRAIRDAGWPTGSNAIKIATLRAKGDRLVWWEWAGLPVPPPDQHQDPDLIAQGCSSISEWVSDLFTCVTKHGLVLKDPNARSSVDWVVGP